MTTRKLTLTEQRQARDELHFARQMGAHMDNVIGLLTGERRYVDCLCVKCGRKETAIATGKDPGEIRVVCADCASGDSDRLGRPDTGWT